MHSFLVRCGEVSRILEQRRCEEENSLKPQARISLNYRAKEYIASHASLPSFYKLHASLVENTTVLEISLLLRDMCFYPVDRLAWYMVHFCLFVLLISTGGCCGCRSRDRML
ncbi:uncharacterized protein K444DRAFT_228923 [Hyaloscypha bicolor E]|uniref:Uncharacterized protein n=1 Tax=Hyaloscypha bicolor E TaxID=1095630 RepID=A0A2J6SKP0_9HELO|nr:uncharacterized protein K444DRAFT_228923 [Hyaloscypha bicolor E]PMD51313.1 hypothetical protein K444DRAFT_228923 [Hyaloscypha bicolor E]